MQLRVLLFFVVLFAASIDCHARDWEREFPELACRVSHLNDRMNDPDGQVRLGTIRTLLNGEARSSRLHPPFLRALLVDRDAAIAWFAVERLATYAIFLEQEDVPPEIEVPLVGRLDTRSDLDRQRLRQAVARKLVEPAREHEVGYGAEKGWALMALCLISDPEAISLAETVQDFPNVFVRYWAAIALTRQKENHQGLEILRAIANTGELFYAIAAVEALARRGDGTALPILLDYLDTTDSSVAAKRRPQTEPSRKQFVLDVLADLNGVYLSTRDEWQNWFASKAAEGQ